MQITKKDEVPNSPLNWHMYLNPNGKIAEGVYAKTCSDWCPKGESEPHNDNIACGYELAYNLAGYLLKGYSEDSERTELREFMQSFVGKKIVNFEAEMVELEADGIDSFVEGIMDLGTRLVAASQYFSEHSKAFTPEVVDSLPPEQREVTLKVYDVNQRINRLTRRDNAEPLIQEMQEALKHAIDVGLHEYGLIIRHAVAYGIGNYLKPRLTDSNLAGHLEIIEHP